MNIEKSKIDNNKKYLDRHNVGTYIEEMMSAIINEKPEEPLLLMMKFIHGKVLQNGLNWPPFNQFESSMSPNDTKKIEGSRRPSTSKSYDKPRLSGTIRRDSAIMNNQNNFRNVELPFPCTTAKITPDCNSSLDEEFKLVEETNLKDELVDSTHKLNNLKFIRNASKTKENLLKLITDERQLKNNAKLNLENVMNKKDEENLIMDMAVELSEDPELYSNEFKIQSENMNINQSQAEAVFVKKIPQNNNNNASIMFNVCTNCSKFFESNNGTIQISYERDCNIETSKGSLIMDDIESASQVNGPRMISDDNDFTNDYVRNSKKKISVSDFETTSKAWPIIDVTSESSYKCGIIKTKMSNGNFP